MFRFIDHGDCADKTNAYGCEMINKLGGVYAFSGSQLA